LQMLSWWCSVAIPSCHLTWSTDAPLIEKDSEQIPYLINLNIIQITRNIPGSSAASVHCAFNPRRYFHIPALRPTHLSRSNISKLSTIRTLTSNMTSSNQSTHDPRVISSHFLDSSDTKDNLAIVVLNWKLPLVTPLLLEKGNSYIEMYPLISYLWLL
jgi:hypothetical protein